MFVAIQSQTHLSYFNHLSKNTFPSNGRLLSITDHWVDERLPPNLRYGFIAQEIQKVLPELISVGTDSMQTLGVNYMDIIPILTLAEQEQQHEINSLKSSTSNKNTTEIDALKAKIEALEK